MLVGIRRGLQVCSGGCYSVDTWLLWNYMVARVSKVLSKWMDWAG